MDLPTRPRPWDTSDVALASAVAAESGEAIIAIKEPSSIHALKSGTRAAVSAGSINAGLAMLRSHGVKVVELYDAIGAVHVRMDPALASVLRADPLVDYIEPRQQRSLQGIPGGSILAFLPLGTAQSVPWGIQLVNAPAAWPIARGAGSKVYLIDTGHSQGHEDLPLVPSGNCGGTYGGCDDGYPIPHGTHVLGIWTARDNGVGVVGVAPGVSPADVYVWGACDSNTGSCYTTDIVAGLNAAIFDASVINMSFGGTTFDAAESNAVAQAWNSNIVLVAAGGNVPQWPVGTILYPAHYTNVIGVSGVQPDKSFASSSPCGGSSNYNADIDLAAPFWALSTVPGGYDDESGGWCGTSMATPHVSGVASLIRSAFPTWTNQQTVTRLQNTAEDLGAAGRDDQFGYGLVNAYNALTTTLDIDGPGLITQKGNYTLTAAYTRFNTTPTFFWEEQQCETCSWVQVGDTGPTLTRTLQPNCNPGWEVDHYRTTATDGWGMTNITTHDVNLCLQGP